MYGLEVHDSEHKIIDFIETYKNNLMISIIKVIMETTGMIQEIIFS